MAKLSPEALHVLTLTVLGEAAGEGVDGMEAVAPVIRNRVTSDRFPDDPVSVARQSNGKGIYQFSTWNSPANAGNNPAARYPRNSTAYKTAADAVQRVFDGQVSDPTGGATHYWSPKGMPGGRDPYWAKDESGAGGRVAVGNHVFLAKHPVPPGEIPNLVASQLDTAAPKVAPVPQPRGEATVARLNASFAAPRPVTKSAALAAQQAGGGGGTDAPLPAAADVPKQAYVPGPERRLPIVGPTGDQRRDDLGSMPSAGELARFNGAGAALRPGADIALSAEGNAATPVLAEEGVYTHHIPDQTVTTVQRGLGSLTPDAVETTLPNPPLRGIPGSNGLVAQEAPGAPEVSQQAGAGGKSAPVPRPASDRPAEPISNGGERRLPVIGPTGDQRVDPVGSMPSAGRLSQLKRQQAALVPQRLVGEDAAAPKAVSPKPGVMRITSPDKSGAAGTAAMPMDARPAVADSLVKSAEDAQKRAALTSTPQTYAGQERAVGLAPKKAAAATPSKADPVGLFPSREAFNDEMGLPNYPNGVASLADMEKRQTASKSGIASKANAVLDATAPATAKSAADVPKFIEVVEKVPVTQKTHAQKTVPLGDMIYQGSRDAVAMAEQGRKDAETIQFRTVTRKVLNPDYVEPQHKPATKPSAKASGSAGKAALAPDGEDEKDLNLLQKSRKAVGLPIDGLGPGFLKALQNGFGLGQSKAKAGGKPIVLSAEQIAQAKANPQDHNAAALAAISQGQTSYVSSDGSVQPTVSVSGVVRKTYGD